MAQRYSREHLSGWSDFFAYNPATRHRRRILTGLLAPLSLRSVLDVGCGDGSLLRFLRGRFGCEIHGLDSDESPALQRARADLDGFYPVDILRGSPGRSFDAVVCTEALEHMPDPGLALRNMRAACGGYLCLTVPGGPIRATDRYMGHLHHFTRGELERLVEAAGFRVLRSFAWGFPFHSLYKALQDRVPDAMIQGFGSGEYGLLQKAVCSMLYALFFLNLSSRGCQLFLLAEKR